MGEYIDVGLQSSLLPFTVIISSILLGLYALFGVETENDDDDSDSGSGGLMQPIWYYLYEIVLVFLLNNLIILENEPNNKIIIKRLEANINITSKLWRK